MRMQTAEQKAAHAKAVAACQQRNREAGLCPCGRPPTDGKKQCQKCRDRRNKNVRDRKSVGLCSRCLKPAIPGETRCQTCKEYIAVAIMKSRQKRRHEVLDHYGGKCDCCGETESYFLTIDHVGGTGAEHRRQLRAAGKGTDITTILKKEGFPDGYRVLCMNCNFALGRYGFCPHQAACKPAAKIGDLLANRP